MNVSEQVLVYIENEPFLISEPIIAANLVRNNWEKIAKENGIASEQYCIANYVGTRVPTSVKLIDLPIRKTENIRIEKPDFERLKTFYEEHGLDPLTADELEANQVRAKLSNALTLLEVVEPAYSSIMHLVKTIQVLRQDDAETDTSYSHPDIPFSIFVSVCEDASLLSSLRVAESILHESMHLQLTLLESVIDLIRPNIENYYFSPWRDENRPARGILHGLFVFRAIRDFYVAYSNNQKYSESVEDYLTNRIEVIESEICSLHYFNQIPDLTEVGKLLTTKLLKY